MPGLSEPGLSESGLSPADEVTADVHQVTLTTTDGVRLQVGCASDTDVLTAAERAGYVLPSLCRKGTCGACFATVDGHQARRECSSQALTAQAVTAGGALLCRTYPQGPLAVALRCEDARIIRGGIRRRDAEVIGVDPVSPDGRTVLLRLHLAADEVSGCGVEFEPGQFVELALPGTDIRRAYSLANTANWDGEVELLIRLQPDGVFSTWLERDARPGALLVVHGPQGAFGLRENGIRPRWFVAGGTGLAPIASMLRRMAECGDPQQIRLYLGAATPAQLPRLGDVPGLAQALTELPGAEVECLVRQPDGDWSGSVGTPVDALVRDLAAAVGGVCAVGGTAASPDVYVCGPPALVDATIAATQSAGLPAGQVNAERFLPG
jgi:ferredoxin-NADP reductase/ferredoxin